MASSGPFRLPRALCHTPEGMELSCVPAGKGKEAHIIRFLADTSLTSCMDTLLLFMARSSTASMR